MCVRARVCVRVYSPSHDTLMTVSFMYFYF